MTRVDSIRRVVEVTGLGIAATYFLDPDLGAERRRTAWALVRGGRSRQPMLEQVPTTVPEPEPAVEQPPEPPAPEELVVLPSNLFAGSERDESDFAWPAWGWPFVITMTICAIAAFAAVGLGIWAIEHRSSAMKPIPATRPARGAAVLANPTARRIIGTATQGSVIIRLDESGAALAVGGLAPLAPGERYRVWVTSAGETRAAGALAGRSDVVFLNPLKPGSRVTITRGPRGPQVAIVTVP